MKRITLLLVVSLAIVNANGQNILDGLRYSSKANTGSARFTALSGAFGALGGDLSALDVNPAGGAIFLKSNASFTVAVDDVVNKATYFGTKTKSINTDISLNQGGAIFVFNKSSEATSWKKFTVGFNFQTTQNFDNELFIKGTGDTSIGEFFLESAQGIPLDLLQLQGGESISDLYAYLGENEGTRAQNAFLGYQGYIIDPVDPDDLQNTSYVSNIASGAYNQEYVYLTDGANSKFTINFATQITNDFFVGVNLNTHSIRYDRSTYLFESNSNEGSTVDRVGFENNLSVRGAGFSAQLGGIAKIQEKLRLGLSFETPTWYYISEKTTQYLETRRIEDGQSVFQAISPNVLNVFEDYYILTPGQITASAAYIFGPNGLISFDYSFKDYGRIRLDDYNNDVYFYLVNNNIKRSLGGASTFKLGGEYRINNLSVRGGLRYEESPYKNEAILDNLSGFSLGMGYNFGNYNLDLSYARAEQKRQQQLYGIGLTDSSMVNTTYSNIAFTLGFKF